MKGSASAISSKSRSSSSKLGASHSLASNKKKGSTSAISSKSNLSSSKRKLPPSSAMITHLRVPSNLAYFRDLIEKRIVLDGRHLKELENTPFHNFLRIPTSLSNEQIALDCLIQNFNADKCSFTIGNKECAFGIDDVHRITGLPKEGFPIKMSGAAPNTIYTQLVQNYKTSNEKKGSRGKGKKKVEEEKKVVIWGKRDRMANLIVDMANKDPLACVKLIVAFIIGFILCPRTCRTCPLWAFRYAEQLSTLKNYNWCRAVYTLLCKEMSKAKNSISMRGLGKRDRAGYMGGFSSVLLVWFYDLVGELEYTPDIEGLPPLFCVKTTGKWRRTTMKKLHHNPKFLTDTCQESNPPIHRASPEASRKAELIAIIAKKTYELNELTSELRELEERERDARGPKDQNKEKDDKEKDDEGKNNEDEGGNKNEDEGNRNEDEEENENVDEGNKFLDEEGKKNEDEERNKNEENEGKEDKEVDDHENVEEREVDDNEVCWDTLIREEIEEAGVDDDILMSSDARDASATEEGGNVNKRETPSIKRAVRKRKRKDGPSVTSPYLRLDQPKEGPKQKRVIQILDSLEGKPKKKCINEEGFIPKSRNYPGKALVDDYEDQLIDNFLQLKMTSDTFIWKCAEASVSRLDAYKLLTGGELSDDVVDAFVNRLCYKIMTLDSYDRSIHVTRPWLAQAYLEGNLELIAKQMKENISEQKFLECERILIPIVSSGHWHMVELVREDKKFYHYSSIKSPIYTADAAKFRNNFVTYIESNWTLGKLEHHEIVPVAAPQQGSSLDCGIFMLEFISSIVEKRSITITQADCPKYRAKLCAALLNACDSPYV